MNRGEIEFFIHCLFVSFKLIIIISKGLQLPLHRTQLWQHLAPDTVEP
jgi:hypothetical protein